MAWVGVITDAGKALIESKLASDLPVALTKVKTGSGTSDDMTSATALVTPKDNGAIIGKMATSGGTQIQVSISASETSYTLSEFGIFATESNNDVLVAYYNETSGGINIPTISDFPDFNLALFALISIINSDDVEVTIDPDAYVPAATFSASIAALQEEKLDVDQGSLNAGKFLVVGNDGIVSLLEISDAEGVSF